MQDGEKEVVTRRDSGIQDARSRDRLRLRSWSA